jgi:hypothetical protein
MAQIKFEDIQDVGTNQTTRSSVGFFSLKNDGDEAVVRIMHDSTDTFDIVSTHAIQLGGKFRRVNCCRSPYDPVDVCPLCASGNASQQRFYIHLVQYERDEHGKIVAVPKVWERSVSYAKTIKDLITTYGPLSNVLLIIKRSGAAGSMDTKYSIMYAPPNVYNDTTYPKIDSAVFDNYKALGIAVMDKTPEEIGIFLETGNFPTTVKEDAPQQTSAPNFIPTETAEIATPRTQPYSPAPQTVTTVTRPTRYY